MHPTWRKSTRSNASSGNCVEVRGDLAAVRDSKNPGGPQLAVEPGALAALLRAVKADQLG
ncbi:DUF397 domain-containing protein [Actinosynnema mirum]|uniref:DUF397 domain-containing protein n=1 Tax=Actinosynnema mirum (strain ATCC 29888 / DSM 43827 / JCM 3225 / NBRC 14064 / NCIMB 13271 / NRRL B-12336 / IMRU 3971 / 101) TaxID=446462 RepID=C6WBK8_ACTMD|nr:DUF397 domain-containing protein [Actinosynnema mirum]ACU35576.1 protein of unknown function DUF397 [Actinosynnema mirum DSM 43827]